MFEIQYDFPVPPPPPPRKGARGGSRREFPLETMEPGGFIFYPSCSGHDVSSYISRRSRKLPGREFKTQLCHARLDGRRWVPVQPGERDAVSGIGVWRIS